MKLSISRIMLLAAAPLLFGSPVYSQEINVRARVPFDFVLGDRAYPAGEYVIQTAMANTSSLSINNEGGTTQGLTRAVPCISSTQVIPGNQAKLVFHRIRDTYFLFRVWVGGTTVGREFPRSHRETEMAKRAPKTETVTAANTVH
jgi:hypothetical protein